jgi:hypothetical protein
MLSDHLAEGLEEPPRRPVGVVDAAAALAASLSPCMMIPHRSLRDFTHSMKFWTWG